MRKPEEILESMLGSEGRAQRVNKLGEAERPFAVGGASKSWLEEASSPLEDSKLPSPSFGQLFVEYSTRQANLGTQRGFDQAAEELTAQYQAGFSGDANASQRPFAVGGDVKSWLENASGAPDTSTIRISSLSEIPEGYLPSPEDTAGNSSFDAAAEEQTRQYLAGVSGSPSARRPFAAGLESPDWLKAASIPLVRNYQATGSPFFKTLPQS